MDVPNPVTGQGPHANWLNRLRSAVKSSMLLPGVGYKLTKTPMGTVLHIEPGGGSETPETPAVLYRVNFISMHQDYILCTTEDSALIEGTDSFVRVAKPPLLRFSIANRTIHGDYITYDNYDLAAQSRFAHIQVGIGTQGIQSEEQVIIDGYEVADPIYVFETETGVTVPAGDTDLLRNPITEVKWLDINVDGRYWASKL